MDWHLNIVCGSAVVVGAVVVWYIFREDRRNQVAFEIGKANSQYFMDRIKVQDMRLEL